ncbi:RNA methyltransferase [Fodinibius sp.]|uniref:TrmH family RNA methyltransferase n=1 Tax=Fodinibius sp. TaxID=1872440 RepID=UPI002ACE951E|nr:RNA methyltransferase [Fodinibius sp.]MDZ7658598.1 RNA methyltransferase [Fodinibius sp.]
MNLSTASNRQQTLLRKLNRKKYRYKERLFLLEGARAVQQVVANQEIEIQALFFDESQRYWEQADWKRIIDELEVATLSRELFMEVSDTDTPQGVLALCEMPTEMTPEELADKSGLIVALDGLQDPGNLGTIIRTAGWFGISGIISGKGTVDMFHPKVVRGTAGATGTIPFMNGELSEVFDTLERENWEVFLLDAGAESKALHEISSLKKGVIVVGNEGHGIRDELMTANRSSVRIPSPVGSKNVESLNAAIAASIALYDLSGKM